MIIRDHSLLSTFSIAYKPYVRGNG